MSVGGFEIVVLYLLILAVLAWWFLEFTPAGRYIHATGSNAEASRLSGVRVNKWSWVTLIISGTIAGIASRARRPVGAENVCRLGRCSAQRGPASSAGRAGLGPSGRAMIFGLWV